MGALIARAELWFLLYLGVGLNPDKFAENQCVDLVDHLAEFLYGVPWQTCVGGVNGARDLLDVAPDKYWQRIDYYPGFIPQRWDVGVMGGDYLNPYGHTFAVLGADAGGMDVIQQDGFAPPLRNGYSIKPAHTARLGYSQAGTGQLLGVLRPRPELIAGGITVAGNTQEEDMDADQVRDVVREELAAAVQPGETGKRLPGPLYQVAADLAWLRSTFTTGEAGKRQAGEALRLILEAASK